VINFKEQIKLDLKTAKVKNKLNSKFNNSKSDTNSENTTSNTTAESKKCNYCDFLSHLEAKCRLKNYTDQPEEWQRRKRPRFNISRIGIKRSNSS
jgi:radical SAM protein with 4Fe4S-binding SPASM domain